MTLAAVNPWLILWVPVISLAIGFLWTAITIPLAVRIGRAFNTGGRP